MKDIATMYGMTEIVLASLYAPWDGIKWKISLLPLYQLLVWQTARRRPDEIISLLVVVDTVTDGNQDWSDSDDNPEDYFINDENDESDSGDEL